MTTAVPVPQQTATGPTVRSRIVVATADTLKPQMAGPAIRAWQIASALADASGEQVDKRTIVVTNPIKALGSHEVSVKLHDEVSAVVALNVIPA